MREDALERNFLLRDEFRAFLHAHGAEGPGADQRHLPAQHTVAEGRTGPGPNTASVSPPAMRMRRNAPYAVPVPQATAAPSAKESSSGSGTSVRAGTFR